MTSGEDEISRSNKETIERRQAKTTKRKKGPNDSIDVDTVEKSPIDHDHREPLNCNDKSNLATNKHHGGATALLINKVEKDRRATNTPNNNNSSIWLDGKFVRRPNYPTSYGILLYRRMNNDEVNGGGPGPSSFQYLLGLIPQGNFWTVFKGLPEENERPEETAIREFEEETSLTFPYCKDWDNNNFPVTAELFGVVPSTRKLLHIFLMPAPPTELDTSKFDVEKVVKIDSGYYKGKPEIIEIRFLTKQQAMDGVAGRESNKIAKIYKSQIGILEQAETTLHQKSLL